MGILSGYGDGTFKPEKEVTVAEFLKTMVIVLGAENISEVKGGFYRGYINVAKNKKIIPSNVSENDSVNIEIATSIMYDTLLASVTDITSLGNNVKYEDSNSLLYTNFGIYSTEGVLTNLYGYSVNGISECEKNEIVIAKQTYLIGEEDNYTSYFGDNTVCFFEVDSSDKYNVIYLYPKNENRLTVSGRDIEDVERNSLKLENTGKSIKMESDAVTVYGGANYGSFANTPKSIFTSHNADITFIDNDDNGKYDIALVFEYETVQAMFFGKNKKIIYLNEGLLYDGKTEIVLGTEEEDNEVPYYVYDEGDLVSPDSIRKNDILTIAKSKNRYGDQTYTIHVSRYKISGKIETLSDDEAVFAYSGDEAQEKETLYVASNYRAISKEDLELGVDGDYYINHRGEIAAFAPKGGSDGTTVGYLTSVKIINNAFDSKIGFQILDVNGKLSIYEGVEKITVKTTMEKDSVKKVVYKPERYDDLKQDVIDTLRFKDPETGVYRDKWHGGLCKYVLDEDGKLTELILTCDLSAKKGYAGSDKNNFSLDLYYNDAGGKTLRCLRGWITPKIRLSSTKVFYVPDEIINDSVDEDDYMVGGMSLIGGNSDYYYNNFKVYDVGEDELALGNYLVKEYSAGSGVDRVMNVGSADNNMLIVTGMTISYDESKGQVYKLTGMRKASAYSCMIPVGDELPKETNYEGDIYRRGISFTDIKPGDILQCKFDATNKIEGFRMVYRKSTDEGKFFGKGGYTDNNGHDWFERVPETKKDMSILTLYGKVAYYDTKSKIAAVDCRGFEKEDGYSDEYYYVYCNFGHVAKVMLLENDKASVFTNDKIEVGDTVFVYGFWNETADVIVMR